MSYLSHADGLQQFKRSTESTSMADQSAAFQKNCCRDGCLMLRRGSPNHARQSRLLALTASQSIDYTTGASSSRCKSSRTVARSLADLLQPCTSTKNFEFGKGCATASMVCTVDIFTFKANLRVPSNHVAVYARDQIYCCAQSPCGIVWRLARPAKRGSNKTPGSALLWDRILLGRCRKLVYVVLISHCHLHTGAAAGNAFLLTGTRYQSEGRKPGAGCQSSWPSTQRTGLVPERRQAASHAGPRDDTKDGAGAGTAGKA